MQGYVTGFCRRVLSKALALVTGFWPSYSRLFLAGEKSKWVIWWERKEMLGIAKALGIKVVPLRLPPVGIKEQAIYFGGPYFLNDESWFDRELKIAFDFYHGDPKLNDTFKAMFDSLTKHHHQIERIRVSYSGMRDLVLKTGIVSSKVHLIPIAINVDLFPRRTRDIKRQARRKLEIPDNAVVIGSFQKDGDGWGDGNNPKMIKGPDVFVQAVKRLSETIPNVHVLLSGPSRGYVKNELTRYNIPFTHIFLKHYPDIKDLYYALDVYLVTSRVEGGPKAVLESMACGVPLITTRVGQAMDLVKHRENGWIVDVEDIEGIVHWTQYVLNNSHKVQIVLEKGLKTVSENSYKSQIPLWRNFYSGFVDIAGV